MGNTMSMKLARWTFKFTVTTDRRSNKDMDPVPVDKVSAGHASSSARRILTSKLNASFTQYRERGPQGVTLHIGYQMHGTSLSGSLRQAC